MEKNESQEKRWEALARDVVRFDIKKGRPGRKNLGKSSGYGRFIKYIVYAKGLELKDLAEMLGVTTQNLNYVLNESKQENFSGMEIERYSKALRVSKEMMEGVGEKVEKMLKANKGNL